MKSINRFLVAIYCFFNCVYACGLNLTTYNRNAIMPRWEQQALTDLITYFEAPAAAVSVIATHPKLIPAFDTFAPQVNTFVNRFIACSRGRAIQGADGDAALRPVLRNVANNPIGREMMYRIVAKLEPRIACVNSIDNVIAAINNVGTPIRTRAHICHNFLVALGLADHNYLVRNFSNETIADNVVLARFRHFFNTPYIFTTNNAINGLVLLPSDENVAQVVLNNVIVRLRGFAHALRNEINDLCFELRYDPTYQGGNMFFPATNIVLSTGIPYNGNLVTGPVLSHIAVVTTWCAITMGSCLKHELGHYLRVGLEHEITDRFFIVANILLPPNVPVLYRNNMWRIWTNTEELCEIFGIRSTINGLQYDYLNQSEFNIEGGSRARYAHINAVFTRVPYYLFNIFRRGGVLPISNQNVISYNADVDAVGAF